MRSIRNWIGDPGREPWFYLAGYAGSGKTTLAREFSSDFGNVRFAAFTGKAALVMSRAGCLGAQTIHSLIYSPSSRSRQKLNELREELEGKDESHPAFSDLTRELAEEEASLARPCFKLNEASAIREADLVVIDEVSMVDEPMGEDLCSFKRPILVLGDPAQLPPVAKSSGYFTRREPHFFLRDIHRQAKDSPVLSLATDVRMGRSLQLGTYGSSRVLPPKALTPEEAMTFDQIIVGKNETRRGINARIRQLQGRKSTLPEEGDKLVCLRNDRETGLLNGSFWTVIDCIGVDEDKCNLVIECPDEGRQLVVTAHRHHFEQRELPWYQTKDALEFDYGYAITCHKAQGSQWPKVLVYDQSWIARDFRRNWLYTALTRASESVTVVLT